MKSTTICAVSWLALLSIKSVEMFATYKMTNAICLTQNKSWVLIEQCRLRAVSRNVTTLNIVVNVLHPAHNIHLKYRMWKKASGYKPFVFDYMVDGCAFMRKVNHPFFKIMWDMIKDFSTINHTCPYEGIQYLKGFHWDARNLSLPLPSGDYVSLLTWMFDKRPQFETNVYFTFKQDFWKD